MLRYVIEGTTDEIDTCDCCGKTGLKSTVCFLDRETGAHVYFGSTCAKAHTGKTLAQNFTALRVLRNKAEAQAMQTPEYKDLEILRRDLDRQGVPPGKQFREATRALSIAFREVQTRLIEKAKAGL